jgi:hypothetical protein
VGAGVVQSSREETAGAAVLSATARCYGALNRCSVFGDVGGSAAMRAGADGVAFSLLVLSAHETAILIAVAILDDSGKVVPGRQVLVCRRIGAM